MVARAGKKKYKERQLEEEDIYRVMWKPIVVETSWNL